MTAFVEPATVDLILELAKAQTCTCARYQPLNYDDVDSGSLDQCFPHVVVGLLRPTVTAWEPTL